ncbi:MAG: FtsW/RodA/SpoVE family cell cycle protein [Balneolaceae bacterium]
MFYTTPNSNLSSILGTSPNDIDMPSRGSDRLLLTSVIVLMIIGVLAVYSSIAYFAQMKGTTAGSLVSGHMIKLVIAFVVMLIFSKIDYQILARFSRVALVLSWILLVGVMAYGDVVFGARRSLSVGSFSFQHSSLASVALILHIAVLLRDKQEYIKDFSRAFLPILFWIVITCALIGMEDFSSAGLLMSVSLVLMFAGRINTLHLGTLVLIGLIGGSALVSVSPERQSRLDEYVRQVTDINSTELVPGAGYQAQQAYIAIAQGNIFGVGIGKSTQRDFLPAPYNDFIFAIIAEEYGVLGSSFVILLFTFILLRGVVYIARNATDVFGTLLALGCTLCITLYGYVNAAVASGLLPVTGLPMPFISYGGTSMLFTGVMIGILLNISKQNNNRNARFYVG